MHVRAKPLLWLLVVVLLVVGPISAVTAQEDQIQVGSAIVLTEIRIYVEADAGSDDLAQLVPGDLVEVLDVDGSWTHVVFGEVEGWMRNRMSSTGATLANVSGPTPGPRAHHAMAYDSESARVILYGGNYGSYTIYDDTWAYDCGTNTWTQMGAAGSPTSARGPMAYDAESDRMILFAESFSLTFEATPTETWAYDFNTDTWTNMAPAEAPPPSFDSRMAYDSESDRVILFGGIDTSLTQTQSIERGSQIFLDHTWAYDFNANKWTRMNPPVSPPPAASFVMAYDEGIDRVVVQGLSGVEHYPEIWQYDYNADTWEKVETDKNPGDRVGAAMTYVTATGQLVLFSGGPQHGHAPVVLSDDTWSWRAEDEEWTELLPEVKPGIRDWHAMAYCEPQNKVVLFGGMITGDPHQVREPTYRLFDTWLYDPAANTWTQVGP